MRYSVNVDRFGCYEQITIGKLWVEAPRQISNIYSFLLSTLEELAFAATEKPDKYNRQCKYCMSPCAGDFVGQEGMFDCLDNV